MHGKVHCYKNFMCKNDTDLWYASFIIFDVNSKGEEYTSRIPWAALSKIKSAKFSYSNTIQLILLTTNFELRSKNNKIGTLTK